MKSSKLFLHYIIVILGLLTIESNLNAQSLYPGHSIAPANNVYDYTYNQTPAQLIEIYPPGIPNTGFTYQWWSSTSPATGFSPISGATAATYSPPALTVNS